MKRRTSTTEVGKKLLTFLRSFTLCFWITWRITYQAWNQQWCNFRRHQQKHRKKQPVCYLFVFTFCLNIFFILWEHTPFRHTVFIARICLWGLQPLARTSAGVLNTLPFCWTSSRDGFPICKTLPTNSSFFLLLAFFFFFVSQLCTQYWAIIKERRMKTAAAWEVSSGYDSSSPDAWKMSLKFSLP